jgi:hypothetical protein
MINFILRYLLRYKLKFSQYLDNLFVYFNYLFCKWGTRTKQFSKANTIIKWKIIGKFLLLPLYRLI